MHLTLALLAGLGAATAMGGDLQYTIVDLGLVDPGDFASQGFRVSPGGVATGRSIGVSNQAFAWTQDGGLVGLPNLAGRPYAVANDANDAGLVIGTGSTTLFGSDPLPLIWEDGTVTQLPLPLGESVGRANGMNASGQIVGSIGSGSFEFGVIYTGQDASVITTTTVDGSFIRAAFDISDDGLVVGFGIDPNNAARNVGFLYDSTTDTAFEVGALDGLNGAIAFGVSNAGHVVGASMLNQGSGTPFVWTQAGGIQEIPLPVGTSSGSARSVNSDGWAVGTASSAFAIPFVFDGDETHRLADLLPEGTGWDLSMNTSSSALGISESGIIVGTGELDGQTRAYAMIPVTGCDADCNTDGSLDILDFVCFQNAWTSQDDLGDCDGNGSYDILDFVCYQNLFTAGCD